MLAMARNQEHSYNLNSHIQRPQALYSRPNRHNQDQASPKTQISKSGQAMIIQRIIMRALEQLTQEKGQWIGMTQAPPTSLATLMLASKALG